MLTWTEWKLCTCKCVPLKCYLMTRGNIFAVSALGAHRKSAYNPLAIIIIITLLAVPLDTRDIS